MSESKGPGNGGDKSEWRGAGSAKQLKVVTEANAHQREWFRGIKERTARGEPFALVNADVPQEIFRAMDIPYAVNQWWAALCSAKQMAPYYLGLLNEDGYREDLCRYCSLGLASSIDPRPETGPWGGLPKPSLVVARLTCDGQMKIFSLWSQKHGIPFYPMENTIALDPYRRWWEKSEHDWEDLLGSHRLDQMVDELEGLIKFLELTTGKTFSETRFRRIMELVNEQEEYYTKTRDLIAETVPAPLSIVDSIPGVMLAQWHRGTEWGVNAARMFYDEVKDRVDRGEAACHDEKIRLMWIGTGLWYNLGFYQHFQDKYGAVFLWSIYLGIAADGYARYGLDDPLRAMASRFVGMSEMLNAPPWNCEWYVKEAKKNGVKGAVHLVSDSCTQSARGSYFVRRALEDAGIPVLELKSDTVDARTWDDQAMKARLSEFIETRLVEV